MKRAIDLEATLVEVRGDDARSWANGQLTCDVSKLPAGGSLRGLRLGKNGRIQALVYILDAPGGLDLVTPRAGAEELLQELDRYVIMEDVELALRLDQTVLAVEDEQDEQDEQKTGTPAEVHGRSVRLVVTRDVRATLDELGATLVPPGEAETLRVAAGAPGAPELGRGLLPQEAGLKDLVSFTKGCYLGQEPVVMLEHRGRAPKRLARLRLSGPAKAGASVALESGENAGELTSVASSGGGTFALALLKKRAEDELPLRVEGAPVLERSWVGGS